jgi:hypothetical protein
MNLEEIPAMQTIEVGESCDDSFQYLNCSGSLMKLLDGKTA